MVEYTKLSEALEELEKRKHLRPKIEARLKEAGLKLPWDEVWGDTNGDGRPLAVMFRQIATPNYEILRFLSIASGFGMQPLILEYFEDKLSMENDYKKALVCAPVVKKISGKGHVQFEKKWLCDPSSLRPLTPLNQIVCTDGSPLPDVHHRLWEKTRTCSGALRVDGSSWFKKTGGSANDYYEFFFTLFVSHAILFENFPPEGPEEVFTKEVVVPNFEKTLEKFQERPLVIPINPTETEDETFWVCYPKEVFENKWEI